MANPHWTYAEHIVAQTAAPDPVITLTEAKAHCRVDHTDDDTYLTGLVAAATAYFDGPYGAIGKAIGEQSWKVSIREAKDHMDLPVVPAIALTSVQYYDTANTLQTINVNQFRLVSNEDFAYLEPVEGFIWPELYDRADALQITYSAGFETVPADLLHAIKLTFGHWYENREAASERPAKAVDMAVEMLTAKYRIGWIG